MNSPAATVLKPPRSLILIGASTGGTRVLTRLINQVIEFFAQRDF